MSKQIQPAHVNEVLRVSAEMTEGDAEAQMNVLTRALILAAIHYNVPPEVVVTNFREMHKREPENVISNIRRDLKSGTLQ